MAESSKTSLKISGKKFEMSAASSVKSTWSFTLRPGGWVIATSDSGERRRLMLSEFRNRISGSLNGNLWMGEWLFAERGTQSAAGSESDLIAEFPGKVRKILVHEGASVPAGEPLLLIEAMKMEFSIRAPFKGKVSKIFVHEGQQLTPGTRFLDLEASYDDKK